MISKSEVRTLSITPKPQYLVGITKTYTFVNLPYTQDIQSWQVQKRNRTVNYSVSASLYLVSLSLSAKLPLCAIELSKIWVKIQYVCGIHHVPESLCIVSFA